MSRSHTVAPIGNPHKVPIVSTKYFTGMITFESLRISEVRTSEKTIKINREGIIENAHIFIAFVMPKMTF